MRQHGAKPLAHAFTLAQGVGGWGAAPKRQRSPQHADLAHTSAVSRGQGHAQKINLHTCNLTLNTANTTADILV
ncbi:MAG: hypothetical protein NZ455_10375 [Bacteroidia bacterium]|nr:hypothetical protein [Bacteroidia bacterium]MDW8345602.1 hypothetical protein [Bacteroidia bacterium]